MPLTEALEMLGFATVDKGDLMLTVLGETFAEGSILARKEIFATRIRRVPLVKWLLALLDRKDDHQLETDVVAAALGLDFPVEEAAQQLDILINWGRYAEILVFDADAATIFPEPAGV